MIDGRRERARSLRANHSHDENEPSRGIGAWVARRGVTADAITAVGIVFAGATGAAIGAGWFYLAAGLLIVGGLMDTLDGLVAKAAGSSSPRGAFFDSVSDRIADGFIFGGLAFYFLDRPNPRLALLPIAILVISATISYERAKAESLGFTARGGLMERAERLIVLGAALLSHFLIIVVLTVLLVLTTFTAISRFVRVWNQASGKSPEALRAELWKKEIDERWRTWRSAAYERSVRRNRREVVPLSTRLRAVWGTDRVSVVRSDSANHRTMRTRSRRARRTH